MELPPMLSPTLPAQFGEEALPFVPLSPTLPQRFEKKTLVVSLKYKPMPKIKKQKSTRSYSSSEDEAPPARARAPAAAPQAVRKPSLPPLYREHKTNLQNWVQQARAKKHESDSAISSKQHRLAAVVSMDSIICFIRAFDYEDRADKLAGRTPHIRSWETLVPYLSQMVTYLESVDSDIAAVCYLIRAVLQIYIGTTMQRTKLKLAPSGNSAAHIFQKAVSDFAKGLMYLPLDAIAGKYHLDWKERRCNRDKIDPVHDQCVLPLHVDSTMQDAAAFAFSVTREWAQHESIEYEWVSADSRV